MFSITSSFWSPIAQFCQTWWVFFQTFRNVFLHSQVVKRTEEVLKSDFFYGSPEDVQCSFDNTAKFFRRKRSESKHIHGKIVGSKKFSSKRSSGHVEYSLKNNVEIIFTKRPEIFLSLCIPSNCPCGRVECSFVKTDEFFHQQSGKFSFIVKEY